MHHMLLHADKPLVFSALFLQASMTAAAAGASLAIVSAASQASTAASNTVKAAQNGGDPVSTATAGAAATAQAVNKIAQRVRADRSMMS